MLSIKNIYKNFGDLKVLKGVSEEIEQGEVVAIIGPSGSGKSTMLRCMNLLEEPTYGEVWLGDDLLTPADPYLHFDVIETSKTYKTLFAQAKAAPPDASDEQIKEDIIKKIKAEDFLLPRESIYFNLIL